MIGTSLSRGAEILLMTFLSETFSGVVYILCSISERESIMQEAISMFFVSKLVLNLWDGFTAFLIIRGDNFIMALLIIGVGKH
jgi:hypothetical protein